MKNCDVCEREFSDYLELCPQCGGVLKVSKKKSRRAMTDSDSSYMDSGNSFTRPDIESDSLYRSIFRGRMAEVEYVKEVLSRNNIPSIIDESNRRGRDSTVDLKVSVIYANQAEELIEDIWSDPKFTMLSSGEDDSYWRDNSQYGRQSNLRENIMRGVFIAAIVVCLVMIALILLNSR